MHLLLTTQHAKAVCLRKANIKQCHAQAQSLPTAMPVLKIHAASTADREAIQIGINHLVRVAEVIGNNFVSKPSVKQRTLQNQKRAAASKGGVIG